MQTPQSPSVPDPRASKPFLSPTCLPCPPPSYAAAVCSVPSEGEKREQSRNWHHDQHSLNIFSAPTSINSFNLYPPGNVHLCFPALLRMPCALQLCLLLLHSDSGPRPLLSPSHTKCLRLQSAALLCCSPLLSSWQFPEVDIYETSPHL